jgi:hypothetical protein
VTRENWRLLFRAFAETLSATQVYITIDLDCLREEDAVTDWEQGAFHDRRSRLGFGGDSRLRAVRRRRPLRRVLDAAIRALGRNASPRITITRGHGALTPPRAHDATLTRAKSSGAH